MSASLHLLASADRFTVKVAAILQTAAACGVVLSVFAAGGSIAAQPQAGERGWLNPMTSVEKAKLRSFLDNPLFDPTRRLPPPAPPIEAAIAPPPTVVAEPPPALHLLGVIGTDKNEVAVVRLADGKTGFLRSGDALGSWTVEVLPVKLRIRNGKQIFEFGMFAPGGSPGPAPVDPKSAGEGQIGQADPGIASRNARLSRRTY